MFCCRGLRGSRNFKRWGMDVAKRRGSKRAKVTLARKIGVILHRMWVDGTTYRWTEAKPIATQA
jgi:transposase